MQNILITGAFGFVGSNLSSYFSNEKELSLIALDLNYINNKNYSNTYLWSEISKIKWEKIDCIIHLAGIAHDTNNTLKTDKYFEINVGLTKLIFDFFLESHAKKFIFFSSVKAVADTVYGDFLIEEDPPNPQTPYGKSKLEAEQYILKHSIPKDKRIYILRPCMIHGPGNKGNLNLLYKFTKKGIPYPLGAFENKRSFTSIDNLIFVIENIINKDIVSGVYQISDDKALSTNEVIEIMTTIINKKKKIWNLNKKMLIYLAKIGDLFHLPFNSERLQKLTENYIVSNEKIKKALNIINMPTSSSSGLVKTIKSFEN